MKLKMIIRSWKTTLAGLAAVLLGVLKAIQNPNIHSIGDAFKDPVTQFAMILAVLGFISKDANVSGDPKPETKLSVVPADGPEPPKPPPQEAIDKYNATASKGEE